MKQLVVDESLSEEARESAKKAMEVLVSSQLFDIEQAAALKKVESEAQFELQKLKAEDAAAAETFDQTALVASQKDDQEDQETLAASKKEMKEWLRGHRLQNYAADVTRIAGECVASLPSLSDLDMNPCLTGPCLLAGRNVVPSDLQYLTDENITEIGTCHCTRSRLFCRHTVF